MREEYETTLGSCEHGRFSVHAGKREKSLCICPIYLEPPLTPQPLLDPGDTGVNQMTASPLASGIVSWES